MGMIRYLATSLLTLCAFCNLAVGEPRGRLKIGVILPLTGALAEYGAAARNGIELAGREHPEIPKNIEFIFEDSQYDNNRALAAFRKLRNFSGVSLTYVWGYGPNQALIPVAESEKSPIIAVTADREAVRNRKFSIRFAYDGNMIASVLIDHLRSRGLKRWAFLKTELAFINGIFDGMRKRVQHEEVIELVDSFEPGDADFKSSIVKLRSRNFDALGVFLISGQVSQFYKQSRQLGLHVTTFGTDFLDSQQEIKDAAGAMSGAVLATGLVNPQFANRYRAAFGNDLQLTWAANGYEFATLAGTVFNPAPSQASAEAVIAALRATPPRSAGAAHYQFRDIDNCPGFDFEVGMRKVLDQQIVDLVH